MIANIISRYTYVLQDVFTVSGYEISLDGDYNGKSQLTVHRRPDAAEEDFLILNDNGIVCQGIISNIENVDDSDSYTITVLEMPRLFDQKVILTNETLLATGIEDFVADQIKTNFISNSDEIVNIPYLSIDVNTHTPIAAKVQTEDGIYNLCTYLGNALTNYGIFIDFEFTEETLKVTIEKKNQSVLDIDTTTSEIIDLNEIYEVKALTKLTILWQKTVDEVTTETIRHFYLRTDRTITEDMNDPERAKGSTDVIVSKAEDEGAMKQEAQDKFTGNSYNHNITFNVIKGSKLVSDTELYIGHRCRVKSRNSLKESLITGINRNSNTATIGVTLGNLKVSLIEKLKGVIRA